MPGDSFTWLLMLAVAVSRLALLSPTQGEPDSARFVVGVWQWLRYGPHRPAGIFSYGYYHVLSPGYFALATALDQVFHPFPWNWPVLLNLLSAVAAIATAPMVYVLGKQLVSRTAARMAAVLFLFSPAFWWLGLEAHPQGLAFALFLASLLAFGKSGAMRIDWEQSAGTPNGWAAQLRRPWYGAAVLMLTLSLTFRCDGILLFTLFPVLALWQLRPHTWKGWSRLAGFSLVPGLLASALFLWIRGLILENSVAQGQARSVATVRRFWGHSSVIHQLLPVITAPGLFVGIATLAGIALVWRDQEQRVSLLWLLLATLPGLLFWSFITGDNVRHVIEFWLPLLWIAAAVAEHLRPHAAVYGGIAAMLLGSILVPANSNLTLYPSPDVWMSHALAAARERQIDRIADHLLAEARHGGQAPCYVGAATPPYFLERLVLPAKNAPADGLAVTLRVKATQWELIQVTGPGAVGQTPPAATATINVLDAYSDEEYRQAAQACGGSLSLEYAPRRHLWFFGRELAESPLYGKLEQWGHHHETGAQFWAATLQSGSTAPVSAAGGAKTN